MLSNDDHVSVVGGGGEMLNDHPVALPASLPFQAQMQLAAPVAMSHFGLPPAIYGSQSSLPTASQAGRHGSSDAVQKRSCALAANY